MLHDVSSTRLMCGSVSRWAARNTWVSPQCAQRGDAGNPWAPLRPAASGGAAAERAGTGSGGATPAVCNASRSLQFSL